MTTPEQIDEQCRQLLDGLTKSVQSAIHMMPQEHNRTPDERVHDREIADNRLTLIRNVFSDLISQLALSRNNYAPISKLMDDLLVEIWSYIPASDLLSVSGVCQRWRLLSIGTPKLWTDIDFDRFEKAQIELLLKRAKTSPLHISLSSAATNGSNQSWKNHLQNRRSRIVQRQLESHGWCDRGLVYDDYSMYSRLRHTKKHGDPKEYDDEDSDYEYINPFSFQRTAYALPVSRFDQIVSRAKFLRAMVGGEPSFYVTYKTLTRPMPYLKRLSLISDPGNIPWTPGGHGSSNHRKYEELSINPPVWFSGRAPNLKDLELCTIHPLWNDPIYSKLTRLRIYMPETKTRAPQLLRILQNCPELEYLDLTECVSRHSGGGDDPFRHLGTINPPLHPTSAQEPARVADEDECDGETSKEVFRHIELKNLWYCHLQEPEPKPISDILSAIVCPRLETLVLCSSNAPLFGKGLNATDKAHEGGHEHYLVSLYSQTTQIQFTLGFEAQISVIGRAREGTTSSPPRWVHQGTVVKKIPGVGWSITLSPHIAMSRHFPPQSDRESYQRERQSQLLNDLEITGMYYGRIEKLDIGGRSAYTDEFYESVFSQCYNLRRLRLRLVPSSESGTMGSSWGALPAPPNVTAPKTAMEILSAAIADRHCPLLEEVHISWFSSTAKELAGWVEMRAAKVAKLKKVVVDVYEIIVTVPFGNPQSQRSEKAEMGEESSVLDGQSKARIEAALEQSGNNEEPAFVWGNPEREQTRKVYDYYQSLSKEDDVEVAMEDQS